MSQISDECNPQKEEELSQPSTQESKEEPTPFPKLKMGVKAAPSKKIKKPAKQNIQTKEPDEDPNNHYGNPENTDPQILSQKMSMMVEIKAIKIQIERQG